MAKLQQTNTQPSTTSERGCRPEYRVFAVAKSKNAGRNFWADIGAAWMHEDSEGLILSLNFLPLQGQNIVLRKNEPKDDV